jgi:hypothetical protein
LEYLLHGSDVTEPHDIVLRQRKTLIFRCDRGGGSHWAANDAVELRPVGARPVALVVRGSGPVSEREGDRPATC